MDADKIGKAAGIGFMGILLALGKGCLKNADQFVKFGGKNADHFLSAGAKSIDNGSARAWSTLGRHSARIYVRSNHANQESEEQINARQEELLELSKTNPQQAEDQALQDITTALTAIQSNLDDPEFNPTMTIEVPVMGAVEFLTQREFERADGDIIICYNQLQALEAEDEAHEREWDYVSDLYRTVVLLDNDMDFDGDLSNIISAFSNMDRELKNILKNDIIQRYLYLEHYPYHEQVLHNMVMYNSRIDGDGTVLSDS